MSAFWVVAKNISSYLGYIQDFCGTFSERTNIININTIIKKKNIFRSSLYQHHHSRGLQWFREEVVKKKHNRTKQVFFSDLFWTSKVDQGVRFYLFNFFFGFSSELSLYSLNVLTRTAKTVFDRRSQFKPVSQCHKHLQGRFFFHSWEKQTFSLSQLIKKQHFVQEENLSHSTAAKGPTVTGRCCRAKCACYCLIVWRFQPSNATRIWPASSGPLLAAAMPATWHPCQIYLPSCKTACNLFFLSRKVSEPRRDDSEPAIYTHTCIFFFF